MIKSYQLSELPRRLSAFSPLKASFEFSAEDFTVDEIPAYLPCGEGEHLFVLVKKQNRNTQDVIRQLERQLEIPSADIGHAGLKDRNATTTQWLSLRGVRAEQLQTVDIDGVTFLECQLHQNKLRTSHLKGNRFGIRLKDAEGDCASRAEEMLQILSEKGIPNFFGPQRFGKEGRNHIDGKLFMQGKKKVRAKWLKRFLLSSYQSALFNDLLAHRMEAELLDTVLQGDILKKHGSGGIFVCESPEEDQVRLDQFELSPTACMPGHKVQLAQGESGAWEQDLLEREELAPDAFQRFKKMAMGTRRSLRAPLSEPEVLEQEDGLWLRFSLPSGAYASIVLFELGLLSFE